ncbi:MAG: argininosuccinate lyase [Candidatus Bathyarchaeota archaeon]|nr:argininosuccinate lyase [Candidatus Bathyarchaeota archaeon]MDI9577476.1 argininosuccinate lyase [Thermoproteota archaeon]NLD65808.1 argininosuccinate lyase [Thermoproteota archaeon]
MLHGGRLGDVRDDVAAFTSSRKNDLCLSDSVISINKAHVVMLMEQKIIPWQDGVKLLKALLTQSASNLDPHAEDVHMALEESVLAKTGPEIGGNLHVAKSRNDQVATAIRMRLRQELQIIMFEILKMQESLLVTAEKHVDTVILAYTHLQPAQPVTFAHYLLSHFDALDRDLQRMRDAYSRVNLCPLGACALATTSFPINRSRTAELLGFSDVLENSIDAVGSRDFIVETLANLALNAVNLSRLAEDLIVWSSPDFGTIELPDEFTSTSSIMPQKKNPEVLEVIRARASYIIGDYVAVIAALKSLPSTYNLDFQEMTPKLWAATNNLCASLNIFTKLIPNLKVSGNVEHKAAVGFVGATELANMLVRKYHIAFRTAHKITGSIVKELVASKKTLPDTTPQLIEKLAYESVGLKLTVKTEDIGECSNPRKLVETYQVKGGPSPVIVKNTLAKKVEALQLLKDEIIKIKETYENRAKQLNDVVETYSISELSVENDFNKKVRK